MVSGNPNGLIAENESLLERALQAELALVWPQLQSVACAGDGTSTVGTALQIQTNVLFF